MTATSSSRRLLPWAAAVLLSIAAAFGAIETTQILLERNHKEELATEVKRRAMEIMAVTLNGNVMGSVATMGLVNHPMKKVARGEISLEDPQAMEVLRSVGESYTATGVYVVNRSGIIRSNWYSTGTSLTGVDVKFRPYFQIAMQGKQNVYAAIGTTTGQRALYFAAPLYNAAYVDFSIIGAMVIRLNVDRVDSALTSWPGPALLLSPQQIAFASNRIDWIERIAQEPTPEQLKSIRALKQFGKTFEAGTPKTLPFDITREIVSLSGRRYAVARAAVQWNDPQGEWTLVLLGDLDELMPASRRATIGTATGALVLVLSALFLIWRRRLQRANAERQRAVAELKTYTQKLELDSETKSFLGEISADIHQAASMADFARKFMFHVAPRVEADYGVFYVLDAESKLLTPVGGHGALPNDLGALAIGQGLVGQCAKDRTPIVISDAAETDIRIVWGEAAIAPKSIILIPVAQAERLLGVIVLAALRPIDAEKRALLDAMMPMVTANLEILERNLGTRRQAELLQRQQAHLQETEAWYRGIIESAPDGMLVTDERGAIILANPQIEAMFGYATGSLVGREIEVLIPAAARARHPGLREDYLRSSVTRPMGALNRELRGVRQDGSEFPVEVGLATLPALGERGVCVCASVRDITERRERERQLQDAIGMQRAIFENAPAGIILTVDGIIRQANPRAAEILVATEAALIGQPGSIIWPTPEAYAEFGARASPLLAQGKPVSEEISFIRLDKSTAICRVTGRPVSADGFGQSTIWLIEDITERKQSEQRLRQVLEDSPAAVTIVEEDGTQVFSNRRLAEMLGIPADQMKNRRTTEFWAAPDERPAFLERLKQDGRVDDYEARMRGDDGRIIWVLLNTRWIDFGGQRLLLSWWYDITQRKQAEENLKKRMEELERFSRLTIDREQKMIQLKEEINGLLEQTGKEKKYKVVA